MKYTVISSYSAQGNWETEETGKTWSEAWAIASELKRQHPNMTYHIV